MKISINPSYHCNKNCSFCYLGNLKQDKTLLSLDNLKEILTNINNIETIDLYGGEILSLDTNYINELIKISNQFSPVVNLITREPNKLNKITEDVNVAISVEPFLYTPDFNYTHYNILSLGLPTLLSHTNKEILDFYNKLNPETLEIKPYSESSYNSHLEINQDRLNDLIVYLSYEFKKPFINKNLIINAIKGISNNCNDHIYITPNGKLQTLTYINGIERFVDIPNIKSLKIYEQNLLLINNNACLNCNLFGHCCSEHFTPCNGFKSSIEDYRMRRFAFENSQPLTDLVNKPIYNYENISSQVKDYFENIRYDCVFPAKQIFVDLVYSYLLSKHYNKNIDNYLYDEYLAPSIFRDNIYKECRKNIYDEFKNNIDITKGTCPITAEYFYKEFGFERI